LAESASLAQWPVRAWRDAADEPAGMLAEVAGPQDLRRLPRARLEALAAAVREELIRIGAALGGHFAGSLGAVELAVGLHRVFDTPRDRLIWDVGHQAYAHKMLTGRAAALWRVKRADGPSGFLRRSESPFDVFGAGHAGTSVSAGLGIAEAQRRRRDPARTVVVIGDGAATAGMSFEALNHAGELQSDLRVVFNDNGMSIAPNVGGLARSGRPERYFASLGWTVLGPVDGHDLGALLPALEALRDARGPTLLHVRTCKGRGYPPAEADPYRWHATQPFERAAGRRRNGAAEPSWTQAFADALAALADRDPRVVAITAAMPDGTGLERFARRHPDRIYDVGIAEQHAVTFAAGLASEGLRPVCAIYSSFLQRGFDQIVHDVALQNLPVTFALDRAGLVGADGPTHHGGLDLAYLRAIPNLVVAAPRDARDLARLLAAGVAAQRPFALRFPRGPLPAAGADADGEALEIGRGERLRTGRDVALVGLGKSVAAVSEAAEELAARGIQAEVIDARFVKPLDAALLAGAARRCGCLVSVEDHAAAGGLGSAILELLAEAAPAARVRVLGLPDRFIEHGDVEAQWREAGIDAASVADATRRWLHRLRG
jgi:1-deoxy-D-xylulose-5-phosphate synthase